jgi:tellurite resistance protein TehA-like permease
MTTHPSIQGAGSGWPIVNRIASFPAIYFSMVMATGIVSIAVHLAGIPIIGSVLLWLNVGLYCVFWALLIGRTTMAPGSLVQDLTNFRVAPGFFTVVAGTSVLARQLLIIDAQSKIATVMFWVALPLWALLIYVIFTAFTVKENKPTLAEGIHGGWLLSVVATQAVAVLTALLARQSQNHQPLMMFVSLVLWLCGGMLYIWIISLIFYRYTFFKFAPSDLMPPYWINMGAMAISTLAGATLIQSASLAPFLVEMLPFLKGFTMFFWATATWWIPMLLILGFWRHVYKRFALKYDPLYWGAVFPLGMYSVSTYQLFHALQISFLNWLPRAFAYISLAAWIVTFIGFLTQLPLLVRAEGEAV